MQAVGRFLGAEMERMAGAPSAPSAPSAPPPCVIVLGMHRSGTSLLTGSLEAAGLNLGDVNHAAPFNRKGNKENESIRSFHNELLAKNDASWDRPPKRQIRWERPDEERARSLVEPYVRSARTWGFKDPRTIWMVEGWLRLLPFRAHHRRVPASVAGGALPRHEDRRSLHRNPRRLAALVRVQRRAPSPAPEVPIPSRALQLGRGASGRLHRPIERFRTLNRALRPA